MLVPGEIRVNRSLRRAVRRAPFTTTYDRAFPAVITACARVPRQDQGTWITPAMIEAYTHLHELGFAHSVETWHDDALVGGMYGVSLGAAFFGESMFTLESDASKIALYTLLRAARRVALPLPGLPDDDPARPQPRGGGMDARTTSSRSSGHALEARDAAGTLGWSWPRCDGIGFVGRRVLGRW